jgi:2-dehydropantoate 2-reductase
MKILVVGSGGVGGYFGGKLAKAGFDVTFVARGTHLRAMQTNGLTVKSILGDFEIPTVKATDHLGAIADCDLVILAVKAWQVSALALELKDVISRNAVILPLQNGVMAYEELRVHIPERNLLNGLCKIFSKIESPGVISHFGITPTILFGEMDNALSARVLRIKEILDSAGIYSEVPPDISAETWKKFIPICVSGLLAITKTTYGELRENSETRQMMIGLLNEIYNLSQKIGIEIEPGFVEKSVAVIDSYPYETTSSLTRDVWEGKPSEIEYQNGTVVRLGRKYGVDTPINLFVYSCILPMERKAI